MAKIEIKDKVIWGDGRMTTIGSEEATRRMYETYTDNGPEWRIGIGEHTFAWHGNCWMETRPSTRTNQQVHQIP